jgi:plasmid stabilization system protein ParE
MEEVTVVWTETAQQQLQEIYRFIAEESIIQADNVFDRIVSATAHLQKQPHKFPPDKYKTNNNGDFRAFEIFHYRISYKISLEFIYIVRVRSTYQNPETY